MAQSNFYPGSSIEEICLTCYSGQSTDGCKPENGSSQNSSICPAACNTKCNSSQAYCSIELESITSHGDVGSFTGFGTTQNDIIKEKWTAEKWNSLQALYTQANSVGATQSQGASLSFTEVASNDLITAALYNQFNTAATAFNNGSATPSVEPNDIITAAHSTALETGFSGGKFNSSVCDVCNASAQRICSYDCSCNYNCSHNCNYNCSYNCSHDCSHNCSHNCGTNASTT